MPLKMKVSQNCAAITKQFEACRYEPYICPAGKLTIGYGHTGSDVVEGMRIDKEKADALLMADLQFAQNVVNSMVDADLTQNQFDALCDFVFNCGSGNFKTSTLRRLVNEKKFDEASLEFARWNKGGGKVLPGLVARRAAETALFVKV